MPGGPLNRPESDMKLGRKGQQDQGTGTNVGPMLNHTNVNNFEEFNPAGAKEARGHHAVDLRNVRGHANYK